MKELSPLRLGLMFAGCFLGAGYVSGQELWQFFGSFGRQGIFGLFLTMLLLFFFGVATLWLAHQLQTGEADRVMLPWDIPFLRWCADFLQLGMLFAVVSVMYAGVGALLEQLFSFPHVWGSLLFGILVLSYALSGLKGLVTAFSFSVPLLILATLCFGIRACTVGDLNALTLPVSHTQNVLLGSWLFSALNFACYNLLGTVAILSPFGRYISRSRVLYLGVGLGTLALLLIAASVLLCLRVWPQTVTQALPMLEAAKTLGPFAAYAYALLLFAGMFGTALSSFVGIIQFFLEKFSWNKKRERRFALGLAVLAFLASLFGFGDLISVLYPLFGYGSMLFLLLLAFHFFQQKRKNRIFSQQK